MNIPYIKQDQRTVIDFQLDPLLEVVKDAGELNYTISRLCLSYIQNNGGLRYAVIALVCGVLSNVSMELYRRLFAPYEDEAKKRNGDLPEMGNEIDGDIREWKSERRRLS